MTQKLYHHRLDAGADSAAEAFTEGQALMNIVQGKFAEKELDALDWNILQKLVSNFQRIHGDFAFPKIPYTFSTLRGRRPKGTWSLSFTAEQGLALSAAEETSSPEENTIGVENAKLVEFIKDTYRGRELDSSELDNLRNLVDEHKERFSVPRVPSRERVSSVMGESVEGPWVLSYNNNGMSFSPASKKVGETMQTTQSRVDTILGQ